MDEPVRLALAVAGGAALGALFFGGLWWTVARSLASRRPALWLLASLFLRGALVLAGFHVLSGGRWERLLACLAGFVLARIVLTRLAGRPAGRAQGAGHAP
jgi:F1F0 ATPase subunit 2